MDVAINILPLKLYFKRPSGTSRGILKEKNSWIIEIVDNSDRRIKGVGECSIIESLSPDWNDSYVNSLNHLVQNPCLINDIENEWFDDKPSIKFGVEMALKDLQSIHSRQFFESNRCTNGVE
jgi:hypothetical protein